MLGPNATPLFLLGLDNLKRAIQPMSENQRRHSRSTVLVIQLSKLRPRHMCFVMPDEHGAIAVLAYPCKQGNVMGSLRDTDRDLATAVQVKAEELGYTAQLRFFATNAFAADAETIEVQSMRFNVCGAVDRAQVPGFVASDLLAQCLPKLPCNCEFQASLPLLASIAAMAEADLPPPHLGGDTSAPPASETALPNLNGRR